MLGCKVIYVRCINCSYNNVAKGTCICFLDKKACFVYTGKKFMRELLKDILNKSENTTLQLSIFYEKVRDKKYLLKLNNVAQTSSKRFVETPPICLVWCMSYAPLSVLSFICWNLLLHMRKLKLLCLSKMVLIVLHKNTRKLLNHLKQAQKSIWNLVNL